MFEGETLHQLAGALETELPIEAPLEVAAAFGLDAEHGPDSAEAADVAGRPWLDLV